MHKILLLDDNGNIPSEYDLQGLSFYFLQVKYWRHDDKEENARKIRTVGNQTSTKITNLKGSALYHLAVKAYNSAGTGPSSATVNVTTRKPRKDRVAQKYFGDSSNLLQVHYLSPPPRDHLHTNWYHYMDSNAP